MRVDGLHLDLSGFEILPGLVNTHDHLEFALFPRLGSGPYANAAEWARDIYRPTESPVRDHLRVPKHLRLVWGGLRNLLAGVTTVCHHNPYHPVFEHFPIRVVRRFAWAHSFAFAPVAERFAAAPHSVPFILHLGEGTDRDSAEELYRLRDLGALGPRTVLVHAVALDDSAWDLVRDSGASVIWCPRSNLFTLGATLDIWQALSRSIPVAIATDSPLTATGDLLDEVRFAISHSGLSRSTAISLITTAASAVLDIRPDPGDFIAVRDFGSPPDLVVIGGRIQLISADLATPAIRAAWPSLRVDGRSGVHLRFDLNRLMAATRDALGSTPLRLAGREVYT